MKRLILTTMLLASVNALAQAAGPYLVADVDANADTCLYTAQGATVPVASPVVVDAVRGKPANGNRICRIDLSTAPTGSNTITLSAASALWGVASPNAGFTFAKQVAPAAPTGMRLLP